MSSNISPAVSGAEPSSLRLAMTLGVAGLLAGLALVTAYQVTLPIIEENKAEALRRAVYRVVPGATSMKKFVHIGSDWQVAAEGDKSDGVFVAYGDDGQVAGFALVGEGPGFQDTIRLLIGYDPAQRLIVGMDVLESRETPGLGDKIYKDAAFANNFRDLLPEPEVKVVTDGRHEPNQVDAITGATISSRAVVKIVNASYRRWSQTLPQLQEKAAGE